MSWSCVLGSLYERDASLTALCTVSASIKGVTGKLAHQRVHMARRMASKLSAKFCGWPKGDALNRVRKAWRTDDSSTVCSAQ